MTETALPDELVRQRTTNPIRVALSAIVLGVVGVLLALVPGAAFVAFLPALLAGLLGFVGIREKVADRWQAVAGLALAPIGVALSLLTIFGVVRV